MKGKFTLQSLFNIDRRIIFVFIFFAVLIPFLFDFNLPIKAGKNVLSVYNTIEEMGEKSNGKILISFDFDNASSAEILPTARAMIGQIFKNNIQLAVMGNWPNGVQLAKDLLKELSEEHKKEYGKDWVYLGYKAGGQLLMINLGKDFKSAFKKDERGNSTDELGVTQNINTIKDFDYVVSFSAGNMGIEEWVIYAQSKYGFKFAGACTAVMAPDFYPFLQSGQLNGLVTGLAGASQYEALVGKPADAITGMKPQSVAHIILILFILFGNTCYLVSKYLEKRKEESSES